jgi:hypothetical protein
MTTPYFVCLIREAGRWAIHFGDYERKVVDQERRDVLDSGELKSSAVIVVRCPRDDQPSIDRMIAALNS